MRLSHVTRRRIAIFRSNRRGYWSLWLFLALFGVSLFGEFIATFGLIAVIWGCVRFRPMMVPLGVAAYITAAYWFTSSTSFVNLSEFNVASSQYQM